jgi:transcriptional regulator with XRE-family HTH domain
MSQTELADKVGITFQQVQKYEKGSNRISSSRLHQIADVFGVTASYFFDDPLQHLPHNGRFDVSTFNSFCASRDGVALMRSFVKIKNKATRRKIAELVEDLGRATSRTLAPR